MAIAALIVALAFAALLVLRVSAARRVALKRQGLALLLGVGALILLARGAVSIGLALALGAALAWVLKERRVAQPAAGSQSPRFDDEDLKAFAVLGLVAGASRDQVRVAHREKMRTAHPDRGGDAGQAARLNAARDRLLKRLSV